jgi:hypothetical protein
MAQSRDGVGPSLLDGKGRVGQRRGATMLEETRGGGA